MHIQSNQYYISSVWTVQSSSFFKNVIVHKKNPYLKKWCWTFHLSAPRKQFLFLTFLMDRTPEYFSKMWAINNVSSCFLFLTSHRRSVCKHHRSPAVNCAHSFKCFCHLRVLQHIWHFFLHLSSTSSTHELLLFPASCFILSVSKRKTETQFLLFFIFIPLMSENPPFIAWILSVKLSPSSFTLSAN